MSNDIAFADRFVEQQQPHQQQQQLAAGLSLGLKTSPQLFRVGAAPALGKTRVVKQLLTRLVSPTPGAPHNAQTAAAGQWYVDDDDDVDLSQRVE